MAVMSSSSKSKEPRRLGRKRLVFRVLALVAVPLLAILVFEGCLRIAGYGYPTRLFLLEENTDTYSINERFMWSFVPRAIVDSPLPVTFDSTKDRRTYRVFVLGESAVQGTPDPAFSFSRFLDVILSAKYPETRFEVINTGVAAINSHVVRHIARESARHQPDLFIVYMGNNEVVGPYGPGTVFSDTLPSLTAVRAAIWVGSTRVGQLLRRTIEAAAGGPSLKEWHGMAAFTEKSVAMDDPRMATVYRRFRKNLEDVINVARGAGVELIVCTVGTNLRDFSPLASRHAPHLSDAELDEWTSLFRKGRGFEGQQRSREAVDAYTAAAEIDPAFAELWFRQGRCLEDAGESERAHRSLVRARDLDTLRFRADSAINDAIADIAAQSSTKLVDTDAVFGANPRSKGGIPGRELFWEHVHMNPTGNYELARTLAESIQELPGFETRTPGPAIPSFEEARDLLALTDFDLFISTQSIAEMTRRPPFCNQSGHKTKLLHDRAELEALRNQLSESALEEMAANYAQAILARPDDLFIRRNVARFELARGNFEEAIAHLQVLREEMPNFAETHLSLGGAYLGLGRKREAAHSFAKSLELTSNPVQTLKTIGDSYGYVNDWSTAYAKYRQGLEMEPDHSQLLSSAGDALTRMGRHSEATAAYRSAVSLRPDDPLLRLSLGSSLLREGRMGGARRHLEDAVRLDPNETEARVHLAWLLLEQGDLSEAESHFGATLSVIPDHAGALRGMGLLLERLGRTEEAVDTFKRALTVRPGWNVVIQDLDRVRNAAPPAREATDQGGSSGQPQ